MRTRHMVTSITERRRGAKEQSDNGHGPGTKTVGQTHVPQPALKGAKALVVGIANDSSIAYGCAKAFRELGADLALTYLNDKARPHVEPLARALDASIFLPLDVSTPGALESVFAAVSEQWGRLDILVHSI